MIDYFKWIVLSKFKYIHFFDTNARSFYIKSDLSKYTLYMKNIEIYDRSGNDNHQWNFIKTGIYFRDIPYIDNILFLIDQASPEFFDYKINGYK